MATSGQYNLQGYAFAGYAHRGWALAGAESGSFVSQRHFTAVGRVYQSGLKVGRTYQSGTKVGKVS